MRKNFAAALKTTFIFTVLTQAILTQAQAQDSTQAWSKTLLAGEKQFVTLHANSEAWQVDLTDETPGHLPTLVWSRHFHREAEALRFALEQTLRLKRGQDILGDQVIGEIRRFRTWVFLQEFADDLIETPTIDQVAAAKIPDKPFTCAKLSRDHCCIL